MHVRENREHLRSAVFVPVKRMDQLSTGFQAITASVSNSGCGILVILVIRMSNYS